MQMCSFIILYLHPTTCWGEVRDIMIIIPVFLKRQFLLVVLISFEIDSEGLLGYLLTFFGSLMEVSVSDTYVVDSPPSAHVFMVSLLSASAKLQVNHLFKVEELAQFSHSALH